MQWYNPNNVKTASGQPPAAAAATGPQFSDTWNKGATNWTGSTGNPNDPFAAHEAGWDTYKRTRNDAYQLMKSGMTEANPADYAAMDQLRNYYSGQLGDLEKNSQGQLNQFDTNSQRGLANLLQQHKAANAGTGTLGSRQYAGAQGDIVSRVAGDYMQGVMANKNQQLANAGQIQGGLQGLYNQDLTERKYQYGQANDLANYLRDVGKTEIGREAGLPQQAESNWMADVAPLVGAGVGAAFGNPMMGYGIGSAAGGAMRGGDSQGGGGNNLAMLLAMQNQQQQPMQGGSFMNQPSAWSAGQPQQQNWMGSYNY